MYRRCFTVASSVRTSDFLIDRSVSRLVSQMGRNYSIGLECSRSARSSKQSTRPYRRLGTARCLSCPLSRQNARTRQQLLASACPRWHFICPANCPPEGRRSHRSLRDSGHRETIFADVTDERTSADRRVTRSWTRGDARGPMVAFPEFRSTLRASRRASQDRQPRSIGGRCSRCPRRRLSATTAPPSRRRGF